MNERRHVDFTVRKKFKSSNEKKHNISFGIRKENADTEAGNYFLGPVIKKFLRAPVTQYLARKKGTDDYYLMKILLLSNSDSDKYSFVKRAIFHNEYTVLTLLKNHPGAIQLCDFFKDYIFEELSDRSNKIRLKRICMVLECLIPHGHHNPEYVLLNHYLKEERLSEFEALYIFYNLLLIIEDFHNKNIVHRDLKLSNIILNRKTLKVKIIDFYYARLLNSGSEVNSNQEGSLYSLPDILTGLPVLPKTSDMWSAGVILYAMLNGCLPFASAGNYGFSLSSSCSLRDFYLKIMENDCILSNNTCISNGTRELLRNILWKIPQYTLKASEAVDVVSTLLALQCSPSQNPSLFTESKCSDQVVPECPEFDSKDEECFPTGKKKYSPLASNIAKKPESYEKGMIQKARKTAKTDENSERMPLTPTTPKLSVQNDLHNRKGLKSAILRLGLTSVNSIDALSFEYCKKDSCHP